MKERITYYDLSGFRNMLRFLLKTKIKGEIKISTKNNYLIVDIYSVNNIVWRFSQNDIIHELSKGNDSSYYYSIIYKEYKKYIENLYFM